MTKAKRRLISVFGMFSFALVGGVAVCIVILASRPEAVRSFWGVATFDSSGTAHVVETIDYRFVNERHGIYRVLPDVPYMDQNQITVTSDTYDDTWIIPEGNGVRVRIGDPAHTISGNHRYTVSYPLRTTNLGDGKFGWDGVGATWEVPIEHVELDLVAPWKWNDLSCSVGTTGAVGGCTVTQVEPGHLVVSHGTIDTGRGLTVYASKGEALAATPNPRTPALMGKPAQWWQQPLAAGAIVAGMILVCGIAIMSLLRRMGRDWVMAGPASTDAAADIAYASPAEGIPPGAIRVDDAKLDEWTTTAFVPPEGIQAWQGGVLFSEKAQVNHRVAWLLGAALDGYIDLDDADPKHPVITVKEHAANETSTMLAVAFNGRTSVPLGKYDSQFAAMWRSLGPFQSNWLNKSGLSEPRAAAWVTMVRLIGFLGVAAAAAGVGIAAHQLANASPLGIVLLAACAGIGGIAMGALIRGWELYARTPAGSAMWLRVASFRRFIAASEAQHVQEAASRGVLREYTAWAVALGEADHWSKMVTAAGLPPTTTGVSSAIAMTQMTQAFSSSGTAPSSSGGGGVGGGGGGGGGGSW